MTLNFARGIVKTNVINVIKYRQIFKEKKKMNIEIKRVKIFVTIPLENVEEVRDAICNAGAGIIGNYTYCTSSTSLLGPLNQMIVQTHILEKKTI